MVSSAEEALGTLVARFETDEARMHRVGVVSLLIGLPATGLAVPLLIAYFQGVESTGAAGPFGGEGHKGGRLRITGLTTGAESLVNLIDHAVHHGGLGPPQSPGPYPF